MWYRFVVNKSFSLFILAFAIISCNNLVTKLPINNSIFIAPEPATQSTIKPLVYDKDSMPRREGVAIEG